MKRLVNGYIAISAMLLWCSMASAVVILPETGTIYFSGEVSDNDAPIEYFVATYEYSYDPVTCIFTLTVNNLTASPAAYTVSEVFFNVSEDIYNLQLIDNGGYSGATLATNHKADGFGTFDYKLDLGQGNTGIPAGSSATFQFLVNYGECCEDVTLADFFSGLSWGGGRTPAEAAIKFTQGPGGDSVYAIPYDPQVIPEPATNILLGMGIAAFLLKKLRRG